MGNGRHSEAQCEEMIARLDEAFEIISGAQQGEVLRGTKEFDDYIEYLKGVTLDIATSLGIKIVVVGELQWNEKQ